PNVFLSLSFYESHPHQALHSFPTRRSSDLSPRSLIRQQTRNCRAGEVSMSDNIVGLAAVIMIFGIPMAAMYTFYRVRKLRTDERLAALARGVDVPMQPDLPEGARSRRFGILLTAGAIGYM